MLKVTFYQIGMESFSRLGQINSDNLKELQILVESYKRWMFPSNGYAPKRMEVHIRRFVRLPSKGNLPRIDLIANKLGGRYIKHFDQIERVEALGDRLLPGFHQGILMHYPEGSKMKRHRDHPIYAKGAAQVNISGTAVLDVNGVKYEVSAGDCFRFDNSLPHSVKATSERMCICFFYLRNKYLVA